MSVSLARTLLFYCSQRNEWPAERREELRSAFEPDELLAIATADKPFMHPLATKAAAILEAAVEERRVAALIARRDDAV